MPTNNLHSIRAFPDLVRYLEDELGWPLQEYGFDDLTFEYSPAELGLKEEDAAAVKAMADSFARLVAIWQKVRPAREGANA